jgi:hypothetical protein
MANTITTERDLARLHELARVPPLDAYPDDALVAPRVRCLFTGEEVKTIYNKRSAGSDPIPSVSVGGAVRYRVGDIKAFLRGNAA